jgi:HEAT repeat protein
VRKLAWIPLLILALVAPAVADETQDHIDAYLQLSKHEDGLVRAKALEMLGGLGAKGASGLPQVLRLLKGDPEPGVRVAASNAARRLGSPKQIVGPLTAALGDTELVVRVAAASELAHCGAAAALAVKPLSACLSTKTPAPLQISACRALGAVGKAAAPAQPKLILCLNDLERARLIRETAALALGRIGIGPGVLKALVGGLKDKSSGLREASAKALGILGPAAGKAAPALGAALSHRDAMTRWRAAQALGAIGPKAKSAGSQLTQAMQKDVGRDIRGAAAEALGKLGDRAALPALRAHLSRAREHHTVLLAVERAIKRLEAKK